jgi:sugar/nucleoside kinase (ribokinase family)
MRKNVLVLGGLEQWIIVYVDEFPYPKPQTVFSKGFHETIGGTGFGKAVNLSRLGFNVSFHSLIGDDEYGKEMQTVLGRELNFVFDIDPAGSRRQIHIINNNGERLSYFLNHGTLNPDFDRSKVEKLIITSDILVVNTINYTKSLIPLIKSHNKEIWCDIHDYSETKTYFDDYIKSADYIQFSSTNMVNYREFMQRLINQGKKLVICTHAHNGASALNAKGQWIDLPVINRYARIDPNGAGDSFFAGVLYGLENQFPLEIAMRLGMIVAGLSVTTREPSYPGLSISLLYKEYTEHYGHDLSHVT